MREGEGEGEGEGGGGGERLVKNVRIFLQTQKYICGGLLKEISVVGS